MQSVAQLCISESFGANYICHIVRSNVKSLTSIQYVVQIWLFKTWCDSTPYNNPFIHMVKAHVADLETRKHPWKSCKHSYILGGQMESSTYDKFCWHSPIPRSASGMEAISTTLLLHRVADVLHVQAVFIPSITICFSYSLRCLTALSYHIFVQLPETSI